MTAQPVWKLVMSSDYSALFEDETGVYDPEMMIAQEYEEDGETKFIVYRFSIEPYKIEYGKLLPQAWDPSWPHPIEQYEPWFAKDLPDVASAVGMQPYELARKLVSDDIDENAWAHEAIGSHHGYDNFDSYPDTWTEDEMNAKWP